MGRNVSILLSVWKKIRLAGQVFRFALEPKRLEKLFCIQDAFEFSETLVTMARRLSADERGARLFREKPRVGPLSLEKLYRCPEGSLGRNLALHFIRNRIEPPHFQSESEISKIEFLVAHLYETHDVWHVVTGFPKDLAGEMGLQAFYEAQLSSRWAILFISLALIHAVFRNRDDSERRIWSVVNGWVMGKQAKALFGVPWEGLMQSPLIDVRLQLGLPILGAELVPYGSWDRNNPRLAPEPGLSVQPLMQKQNNQHS